MNDKDMIQTTNDKRQPYVAPRVEVYTVWLGDSLLAATTTSPAKENTIIPACQIGAGIDEYDVDGTLNIDWNSSSSQDVTSDDIWKNNHNITSGSGS